MNPIESRERHPDLVTTTQARGDLELIDLDRLYDGS